MRLYFATCNKDQADCLRRFDGVGNILVSNEYMDKHLLDFALERCRSWFLFDSGAFTVWKTGGEVDIKKYAEECGAINEAFKGKVICINLDVIPGRFGKSPTPKEVDEACEMSFENYIWLKNKTRCNIMPVFHQHDKWSWLDRYIDTDCYLLGISPANDKTTSGRIPFLDRVFHTVRLKKRCHGLAVTGQDLVMRYPWFSCDSASWVIGPGYGNMKVMSRTGRVVNLSGRSKEDVIRCGNPEVSSYVQGGHRARRDLCIEAILKLEKDATSVWERRGVTWTD